jgi:hypothetical protein
MAIYTVHEPPLRRGASPPDPESFVFVRDGFSFWAFLLGPLWMLRHRLWLVLLGYLLLTAALQVALRAVGASTTVTVAVGMLVAWLIGFEAATLRRFALARRRWTNIGIVVGDDLEAAERRFFDVWVNRSAVAVEPGPPRPAASAAPILARSATDVIGLFPQPGVPR